MSDLSKLKFNEIAKAECKRNRNIVISEAIDAKGNQVGYSVSEQMIVHEDNKTTNVFLKNGLGIFSLEGLKSLQKIVTSAIEKIEKQQ